MIITIRSRAQLDGDNSGKGVWGQELYKSPSWGKAQKSPEMEAQVTSMPIELP